MTGYDGVHGTDEWLTFLASVVGGLRQAARRLQDRKSRYESKTDWFRKSGSGVPRENSVTRALADMFAEIRAEQAISGSGVLPVDLRNISVECEKPRPQDPGISDHSKPTDLSLVLLKDHELDLRVEAKMILNDRQVRREYTGKRGLLRFDDRANPYTVQPFGGMMAYVVDLDAAAWTAKISTAVETAVGASRSTTIRLGDADHRVSRHNVVVQGDGASQERAVEVVHLVLEVDAKPSRRA